MCGRGQGAGICGGIERLRASEIRFGVERKVDGIISCKSTQGEGKGRKDTRKQGRKGEKKAEIWASERASAAG